MVSIVDSVKRSARWKALRPHAGQSRLFNSKARFDLAECGRRSGKTEILKRREVAAGLEENPGLSDFLVVFGAPTRDQAKSIFWDDLKLLVPKECVAKISESDLTLRVINDTTYAVVGMDRPERIEGRIIDRAVFDEYWAMKPGTWARTIRPCLSTEGREGRAAICSVPRPSAELFELSEIAQNDKSGEWAYHHWTSDTVLTPAEILSAQSMLDARTFAQEYQASRVNISGRVSWNFDRATHLHDGLPYNPKGPLLFCLDFNVEPGPAVVGQEHLVGAEKFTDWLGEVHIPFDSRTELVCRKLIADWGAHEGPILVDGDPSGGQRSSSGDGSANWTTARQVLSAHFKDRVSFVYQRSAPGQLDRANAWNARLRSADGKVHMRFERAKTRELVMDCETVQWKKGADFEIDKPRGKDGVCRRTHWFDAASYLIERLYPIDRAAIAPISLLG